MKRAPAFLLLIAMLCQTMASWASVPLARQVQSLAQALEHGLMVEHHHHDHDHDHDHHHGDGDGDRDDHNHGHHSDAAVHHDSLETDRVAHLHPSEGFQTVALEPESGQTPAQRLLHPRAQAPDDLFRSAALPKRLKPPRDARQA